MASKSRRLPGGKVRRPPSRTRPAPASAGKAGKALPETPPAAPPADAPVTEPAPAADAPWMRLAAAQGVEVPARRAPGRVEPPTGPGALATPSQPVPRRRGAVTARSLAGRAAGRTGPSSLDLAEATLTYVRADLARILILAACMIGIIVVLAVVLR